MQDLTQFMYNKSGHSMTKTLFKDGQLLGGQTASKRPVSLSKQFIASVAELMSNLMTKEPHYIRCIKPNEVKQPRTVNMERFTHQVGCIVSLLGCIVSTFGLHLAELSAARFRSATSGCWRTCACAVLATRFAWTSRSLWNVWLLLLQACRLP